MIVTICTLALVRSFVLPRAFEVGRSATDTPVAAARWQ